MDAHQIVEGQTESGRSVIHKPALFEHMPDVHRLIYTWTVKRLCHCWSERGLLKYVDYRAMGLTRTQKALLPPIEVAHHWVQELLGLHLWAEFITARDGSPSRLFSDIYRAVIYWNVHRVNHPQAFAAAGVEMECERKQICGSMGEPC